jgi:MFS family permease
VAAFKTPAPSERALGQVFWWLFAGSLLSALATFVAPFLALYLTARGLRPAVVGLLASCYGLGALFSGPLAGILSDSLGRRRTLLGALLATAASAVALAFVRPPFLVALAVLVFGAASSASRPPMRATVADVVAPLEVPRAFGWLYWAENAGATVSMAVGGLLAAHGWAIPFLCDGATTLIYAAVVFLRIPETRPAKAPSVGSAGGYGVVLRDRPLLWLLAAIVLTHLVYSQCFVAQPVHMARLGLSPADYGVVSAVSAALVVVLQPFSARLLAWASPGQTLALGAALIALGNGANALCATRLGFSLAFSIWTLGEIAFFATASAAVARLAPESARGRYMGAYGLCLSGAMVLGSAAGPALLAGLGPGLFWGGCLALAGVAAGAFLVWERLLAPDSGRPAPAGAGP